MPTGNEPLWLYNEKTAENERRLMQSENEYRFKEFDPDAVSISRREIDMCSEILRLRRGEPRKK